MSRSSFLLDLLSSIFERGESRLVGRDDRSIEALCEALLSEEGEASGSRLAAALLDRYERLDGPAKSAFFALLADGHDLDSAAVGAAAARYGETRDAADLADLLEAAEPPRQEILRRLNRLPGATGRLVKMRADLLALLKAQPALKRVDLDFRHLFTSWFNRGFLVLRHIDWHTPANILEKIIEYEAVHAIGDWDDLRRRLQPPDRRCFAFFHPAMPDEPLIFVEVALTREIPGSIRSVLSDSRAPIAEMEATTAVFYSISNCQRGLAGISFGNFLIKQVAADLALTHPNLKTFVTLSPVPGFKAWLQDLVAAQGPGRDRHPDHKAIASLLAAPDEATIAQHGGLVSSLAAEYLLVAKRPDGQPLDPVARFHLGNGARLERVNAGADLSRKGLSESLGVMVNYLYDLKSVEANHEAYAHEREVVATRAVRSLVTAERAQRNPRRSEHA